MYVPPAYTRQAASTFLDPQSEANLRGTDVILGVITTAISEACRQELNTGKGLGKTTIVMAEPALASQLGPFFPGNLLVINPADPAQAEEGIVQFLKKSEMEQDAKKALTALA